MRRPATTWIWLAVAGASALLLIATAAASAVLGPGIEGAWPLAFAAWPVVGGLLVAHRPANVVGRLLVAMAASFAAAAATEAYVATALEVRPLPAGDLVAWLSGWVFLVAFVLTVPLVAVFPSGRLASAWLRWPLRVWAGVAIVALLLRMVIPVDVAEGVANPWGVDALAPLATVDLALPYVVEALMALAFVDLVLRWRRSRGVERLQMRWIALALAVFALLVLATSVPRIVDAPAAVIDAADAVAFLSGFGLLPVAIGVAVARYRLYEVDRLLSRTLAYALIVGVLAAVYAAAVFVLRGLLPLEGDFAVAGSTVLVAALFYPLRRRVRRRVDRRFNRARYDARREVDRFATGLSASVAFDDVTADLRAVVQRTLQPDHVSVWIRRTS